MVIVAKDIETRDRLLHDYCSRVAVKPCLGFVAILGIPALIGILIRNAVITVVHIDTLRSEGVSPAGCG